MSSISTPAIYAYGVTPEELANLAHLRRARDLMDREYGSPLDVAALARAALMSTAHFSRQFRATYGETPYSYLMTRRIERATALLRDTDLPVTDIALQTGWTSLGTFGRIFRDITGASPGELRSHARSQPQTGEQIPECVARSAQRPDLNIAVLEKRRIKAAGKL